MAVRVKKHFKNKNSDVYKHINASSECKGACNEIFFPILDRVSTKYQLSYKEGMYKSGDNRHLTNNYVIIPRYFYLIMNSI